MNLFRIKEKLGPLVWGTLVVFLVFRLGDIANLVFRFYMGHVLPDLSFGALDPVFGAVALLGIPVTVVFQVAMKSISRLRETGQEPECRSLILDMMKLAAFGSAAVICLAVFWRESLLQWLGLDSHFFGILLILSLLIWWQPLYAAVLQGGRDYKRMGIYIISGAVTLLVCARLFVVDFQLGLYGAFFCKVLSIFVPLVLGSALLFASLRGARAGYAEERRLMWNMLLPMVVYTFCTWTLFYADKLFIRRFLFESSGGYGAISALGSVPNYFIGALVFVVFPTAAAEHAAGRQDLNKYWRHALLFGSSVVVLCVVGLYFSSGLIMRTWNLAFADYSEWVWLYALAMGMLGMIQIIASVEMACHRYGFLVYMLVPSVVLLALLVSCRMDMNIGRTVALIAICNALALVSLTGHLILRSRAR